MCLLVSYLKETARGLNDTHSGKKEVSSIYILLMLVILPSPTPIPGNDSVLWNVRHSNVTFFKRLKDMNFGYNVHVRVSDPKTLDKWRNFKSSSDKGTAIQIKLTKICVFVN